MNTGINSWLANYEFDNSGNIGTIELPGGWHWEMSQNKTGHLVTPDGNLCVGYDIEARTITFGKDGVTPIPGLNLWTVQEMGEKFARENFMDADTAKEYDQFAQKRISERRSYEKDVREELKGIVTMELKEGKWSAHVDTERVFKMTGIESESVLSKQEGAKLFNQMSEVRKVMPLRDPLGYMIPEGNVYDYIKDQYDFQYNDTIDNIDAGFINGNGYGCEKVLENLDSVVRKNIREYCLPEGIHYLDLRYISTTPEVEDVVDEFVKQRVTKTVNYEKKREHTKEALERDHEKFLESAEALREKIGDLALPPLDIPEIEADNGLKV